MKRCPGCDERLEQAALTCPTCRWPLAGGLPEPVSRPEAEDTAPIPSGVEVTAPVTRGMPAPVRSVSWTLVLLAAVTASVCAALVATAAAAVQTATAPPPPSAPVADARIGPEGGTLRFEGGRLIVPPEALREERHLVVHRHPAGTATGGVPSGPVYRFEPTDLRFTEPVAIIFDLPDGDRPVDAHVLAGDDRRRLPGTIDREARTLTIHTRSLGFLRAEGDG